jgi:hypothetical protein
MNWVGMLYFTFPSWYRSSSVRYGLYSTCALCINDTALTLNIFVNWKKTKLTSSEFFIHWCRCFWFRELTVCQHRNLCHASIVFSFFLYVSTTLVDLGLFFSFLTLYTADRTPWTWDNPSQGRYIHTGQHKHRINSHNTDIHSLGGIRKHDPSVRASEDGSCLRPRGHRDRHESYVAEIKLLWKTAFKR